MKRREEQGVALVVTLILLAIITIVVVAFLGVSQRNRSLTSTATDQINAQFMADAGQERAVAEVAARVLTQPDLAPVQLLVSTNYTRWAGFDPALPFNQRFFNVSYTRTPFDNLNQPGVGAGPIYDPTRGVPLAYDELMQVLTSLYFNPRPPVFVRTNPSPIFPADFRFYLDLNRNGRFDPTGNQFVLDELAQPVGRASLDGDPEWIGVLEHPDVPHSATNRFVGRYAYLVVPEGLTLDLNAVHNYAKNYAAGVTPSLNMASGDRFQRNTGVGTFELNAAAFLVGLNTNAWPGWRQTGDPLRDYFYDWSNPALPNTGWAFNDAWALLRYRHRGNPFDAASASLNNLLSFEQLLGTGPGVLAGTNRVDEYANGPLVLNENLPAVEAGADDPTIAPWSGSPNPNRFQALEELFEGSKMPEMVAGQGSFGNKMLRLSSSNSTYNTGTYYRLLSQLGTDSGMEPDSFVPGLGVDLFTATNPFVPYRPPDRINLNYDNRDLRSQGGNAQKAKDLIPWEPLAFFTNAAARMLRSQVFIGSDSRVINLTNIMVWPTNNYDGAVHRILQVAANLYDSINTNGIEGLTLANEPKFPTVFRPYLRKEIFTDSFGVVHTNVYIAGYQLQERIAPSGINPVGFVSRSAYWDLNGTNVIDLIPEVPDPNVVQPMALGVPLVIGAKKGFPNFNEIAMETVIQMQRNIQLRRLTRDSLPYQTNEFYILGITNVFAIEAWNSYKTVYPRGLTIAVEVDYDMALFGTNASTGATNLIRQWPPVAGVGARPIAATFAASTVLPPTVWAGQQFQVPLMTNYLFLSNSVWRPNGVPRFTPASSNVFALSSATPNQFYIPDWNLTITNRVRYVVVDTATSRIIDYANLDRMNWSTNVVDAMTLSDRAGRDSDGSRFWDMRRHNNTTSFSDPTEGLWNQLMVSLGFTTVPETIWRNYAAQNPASQDKALAIDAFRRFAAGLPGNNFQGRDNPISPNGLVAQAPFAPARRLELKRSYEVNDPLVHYTSYDIAPPAGANDPVVLPAGVGAAATERLTNIRRVNKRFQPWAKGESGDPVATNPIYIDPLIASSDDWKFPDHKLPNIGWMGRVHRGTPWQTVYLKSTNVVTYDVNGVRSAPTSGLSIERWYDVQRTQGAANEHGLPNYSTPDKDWRFLDLFTTAPSATATRGKVSVNQSGDASWSAVLGGVQVLTNRTGSLGGLNVTGSGGGVVIQPGSLEMRRIIDGINLTRAAAPFNGQFRTLGDVLAVPELSLSSPFLNRLPGQEVAENLSDAALERIPQQIVSLLRLGEPRVVVYAYGQTLKPAPFSINLDPNYLNIVTNYQITGEYATRSVVEFQRVPPDPNFLNLTNQSRLRAVILESKVLPPQ